MLSINLYASSINGGVLKLPAYGQVNERAVYGTGAKHHRAAADGVMVSVRGES